MTQSPQMLQQLKDAIQLGVRPALRHQRKVSPSFVRYQADHTTARQSPLPPTSLAWILSVMVATAVTHYVDLNNPTPTAPQTGWSTAATIIQDAS